MSKPAKPKSTVRHAVHQILDRFEMPGPEANHSFANQCKQMRHWLNDPILRSDAAAWIRAKGYPIIPDEQGEPLDFIVLEEKRHA